VGERQGRAVIVTGSWDKTVRVWDLETLELVGVPLEGHQGQVRSVAVGERQGRAVIISGSDDNTVRVWDLETFSPLLRIKLGTECNSVRMFGEDVVMAAGGENVFRQAVAPALLDGLALAGTSIAEKSIDAVAYGDLFRRAETMAAGLPPLRENDLDPSTEGAMLTLWWEEAARSDKRVMPPGAETRVRTPRSLQQALHALSQASFFAGIAERALIWDLKQVSQYFKDKAIREAVQSRIVAKVASDTRVLIAHSLGSVAAYEAACARPELPITTLVTLGSPLGIPNLIFERLRPEPVAGQGAWPEGIQRWTNIADRGDVVALEKKLASRFGDRVHDVLVYHGSHAHDCRRYLTAKETGMAIAEGLTD
jgi:WD domain, G-beta repeat